jgi:CHAT domain-containing protein
MFRLFPPSISERERKFAAMSSITDSKIRSYLLGTLADDTREEIREQIEDTLLVTDEGLAQLELAEEELLDDYLSGQLDTAELVAFEQHFLCTAPRKSKLEYLRTLRAIAAKTADEAPNTQTNTHAPTNNVAIFPRHTERRPLFSSMNRSPYLKLAAALLLVSAAIFLLWRFTRQPRQSEGIVALNRAYANGRTLDVRIGGLDFAPYAPTRGANDADTNARILRQRAERVLLDAYADQPTAANRHVLGKYYLAEKRFDEAIEQFNAALKDTPNLAELHNDLGAALLEKAKYEKRNNQPGDSLQHMAAALEALQQALKLEPNSPAVIFNRALCLQEMYLPRQAIEEWKKYLQLDPKSAWADEARRRLAELEKAPSNISKSEDELYQEYLKDPANDERTFDLFCQSYSTTGNGITERLLDELLAARQSGDTAKATHWQQLLERLGALIYQRTTDPYVRDVARYFGQLAPSLVPKLIQARQHLNDGRQLRTTKQSEAEKQYQVALSLFQQMRDECEALTTTYLLGRLHLRQLNLSKSSELLTRLSEPANHYLWLRCESLNGLAELYGDRSLPDEAIRANQSALAVALQLGNTNQLITNSSVVASRYTDLGNWEQAFVYQQQALEAISQNSVSYQQHWATYGETASHLFATGFNTAALAYQQAALSLELATKRPLQLSRAYTFLGVALGKEARFVEAMPMLKEAISIGIGMENEKQGADIQAFSGLHLANLQRKSGDFAAALQTYERVIKLKRLADVTTEEFEIYRGKALTEMALGNTAQAKQDLTQALSIFERNRAQIFAEKERTTFFDKEYEIYDVAIGFAYADNPSAAFDLSEQGRARSLLELLNSARTLHSSQARPTLPAVNRAQPLTSQAVQRQLGNGTSLLEFACLPDQLLVWGISAKGAIHTQKALKLSLLEQKVNAFLQALTRKTLADNNQTKALAAELYQILLEPLEPFLAQAEVVCIVPDKVLHHLPFAALFSARRQKYLIENYALVTAPSASVFLLCAEHARHQVSRTNERVLAVGNPHFDPAAYPQLAELSAAAREANDVARTYTRHRVLLADQATEEAVKAEIQTATILHLATHGVIDERSALNSRLVLAKPTANAGGDGALRAYEIAQMRLPQTQLAVLSACQSGVERFYRGEGMIGLGRAFLAAGVPTVVASLWTVDSEVTATLMTDFHQQLKTHSASQALRRAQLALLHNANAQLHQPYYWAAFSTFGGDVSL